MAAPAGNLKEISRKIGARLQAFHLSCLLASQVQRQSWTAVRFRRRLQPAGLIRARVTTAFGWHIDSAACGRGDGLTRRDFITLLGGAAAADLTPDYSSEGGPILGGNNSAGSLGGQFFVVLGAGAQECEM
jgi:hypothetical protein